MESHASDPILDFHDLSVNAPTQNRKEALKLLDNAFRTHGFVYLSNHSIPQSLIDESFEWVCVNFQIRY
jgi:isopenicillin N synthase-like dioxygenase